jgi:hypothetical protein
MHNYQCHQLSWVQLLDWQESIQSLGHQTQPVHQYTTHQHSVTISSPPGQQVTMHSTRQCTEVAVSHNLLCMELQRLCLQAQEVSPTTVSKIAILLQILDWKSPPTQWPEFAFGWRQIMKSYSHSYNMDTGRALQAQPFLTLTIGSEFHPSKLLETVLKFHPL